MRRATTGGSCGCTTDGRRPGHPGRAAAAASHDARRGCTAPRPGPPGSGRGRLGRRSPAALCHRSSGCAARRGGGAGRPHPPRTRPPAAPGRRFPPPPGGAGGGGGGGVPAPPRPEPARRRPRSAWVLLGQVAPELEEWATFFAAGAAKRAAAEAGLSRAVTEREADDLVRDVGAFLAVVEHCLAASYGSLSAPEPPRAAYARPRVVGGTASGPGR